MEHPQYERGQTEIAKITYAQLYAIVLHKLEDFHPDRSDPDAFCQDLCCEVEKVQGIYPNVPSLTYEPPK